MVAYSDDSTYTFNGIDSVDISNLLNNNQRNSWLNVNNNPVREFEVMDYREANRRALVGDGLEGNHVPETVYMKNTVPNYNPNDGFVIIQKRQDHQIFHRELPPRYNPNESFETRLSRGALQLNNQGVPNDAIREIIDMNILNFRDYMPDLNQRHYDRALQRTMERNGILPTAEFQGLPNSKIPIHSSNPEIRMDGRFNIPEHLTTTDSGLGIMSEIYHPETNHRSNNQRPHLHYLAHGGLTDSVFYTSRSIRDNPDNFFTMENLTDIGSNVISNVPHHALMHYGQKVAIGTAAVAALPAEISVGTTLGIAAASYGALDYSSCMAHYEHLLHDGGRPYDYRNVGLNSHVCQMDALTNVVGTVSLPIDLAGAAYRGYRNDPVMMYDASDLSWSGRAWNNTHWMGHQVVRGVGNTFNYAAEYLSLPINVLQSSVYNSSRRAYSYFTSGNNTVNQHLALHSMFNRNSDIILNSILNNGIHSPQRSIINSWSPNRSYDMTTNNPTFRQDSDRDSVLPPFRFESHSHRSTNNYLGDIGNQSDSNNFSNLFDIRGGSTNNNHSYGGSNGPDGSNGFNSPFNHGSQNGPDGSNGFNSPFNHGSQNGPDGSNRFNHGPQNGPNYSANNNQQLNANSLSDNHSNSDVKHLHNKQTNTTDFNVSDNSSMSLLVNYMKETFLSVDKMRKDELAKHPECIKILKFMGEFNNILGKSLVIKNWKHLSKDQRFAFLSSSIVGEAVKLDKVIQCLNITEKEASAVGFVCNLIQGGKIKIEGFLGSLTEYGTGYPTGGIVKLITGIIDRVGVKEIIHDILPMLVKDFYCFINPQFAIANACYQAYQMAVNLITHHGELKIGPFNVATEHRVSTKNLKLNNFWKKSGWQEKFTIKFPLLGIEVSTYADHTSEARQLAVEKFVEQAKEKSYAYFGVSYDILCPDDDSDNKIAENSDSKKGNKNDSDKKEDTNDNQKKQKIPKFEDYVKMRHISVLIDHWKDANNLSVKEREIFDRQMRESVEDKTKRLNNKILKVEVSVFEQFKHLDPIAFVMEAAKICDFSNPNQAIKTLYHLFYTTGRHNHEYVKIPELFKSALIACFGDKINIEEIEKYMNTGIDMTDEELEKQRKKLEELESKNFSEMLEAVKKRRAEALNMSLRDFEKMEQEKIKLSSSAEINPMILIVGFMRYIGVDPHLLLSDGQVQAVDAEAVAKGEYSRESIIFWLIPDLMKSFTSVNFIAGSVSSATVGMTCSTLAYIDLELPAMIRSPSKWLVSKSGQLASSTLQMMISTIISQVGLMVFKCSKYSESLTAEALEAISINTSAAVSFGVGTMKSVLDGSIGKRSILETIYNITETVIRNNIKSINEWLILNYEWFKTTTVVATDYASWVLQYMETNFSNYSIYQAVSPLLISFEANTIVGGTIIFLACRVAKALVFGSIKLLSKIPGYIHWLSTSNERDTIEKEIEYKKRTMGLIHMFKDLQDKKEKTLKDNVELILIHKELVERKVLEPKIKVIPFMNPLIKRFTKEEIEAANTVMDNSIRIEDLPHNYKHENNKIYYKYEDYKISYKGIELNYVYSKNKINSTNVNSKINRSNIETKINRGNTKTNINRSNINVKINNPFAQNKVKNKFEAKDKKPIEIKPEEIHTVNTSKQEPISVEAQAIDVSKIDKLQLAKILEAFSKCNIVEAIPDVKYNSYNFDNSFTAHREIPAN